MKRIMAFDFGTKRIGIAVTDPMQIIASGLATVEPKKFVIFLKDYLSNEQVETFVVGLPKSLQNTTTDSSEAVANFKILLNKSFPEIPVIDVDERFTSKMAFQSMIHGGLSKRKRQNKALIDQISATIILQSYLSSR